MAVENAPHPLATYRACFPTARVVDQPAQQVDWAELAAQVGPVDLLTAGPPCEPFTPAKAARRVDPLSRLYADPAGGLVLHTIRAIRALRPTAFAIENVVQLTEGPLYRELNDLFRRAGYRAHFNVLRAENNGTPSMRARLFITTREVAPGSRRPIPVREAIEDLEALDADVPNHTPEPIPRSLRQRVSDLRPGRSLRWWKGATGKTYGTWTRLDYDQVAPTVKGSGRFIHPRFDRALTPREHARLMGFPDGHVFHGPLKTQYDQAGEAVPPPLAEAVVRAITP